MQIKIAGHAGFCFGVKRAIKIAEEVAQKNKKVYVHGQLVHNEKVVKGLEGRGIVFVEDIKKIPQSAVTVLRAHGEPESAYKILESKSIIRGKNLHDATCPLVILVHNTAIGLKNKGYEVILFGKKNHPESVGIISHLKGKNTLIIESPKQYRLILNHIKKNNFGKVAVISQTTMSVGGYSKLINNLNLKLKKGKFKKISLNLKNSNNRYVYADTICNPTKQRQSETLQLAKKSDIMVVIGGKSSSNSKELYSLCKEIGVESHFIQSGRQLRKEWFKGKKKIGITAGASTPDYLIREVAEKINGMNS